MPGDLEPCRGGWTQRVEPGACGLPGVGVYVDSRGLRLEDRGLPVLDLMMEPDRPFDLCCCSHGSDACQNAGSETTHAGAIFKQLPVVHKNLPAILLILGEIPD